MLLVFDHFCLPWRALEWVLCASVLKLCFYMKILQRIAVIRTGIMANSELKKNCYGENILRSQKEFDK